MPLLGRNVRMNVQVVGYKVLYPAAGFAGPVSDEEVKKAEVGI